MSLEDWTEKLRTELGDAVNEELPDTTATDPGRGHKATRIGADTILAEEPEVLPSGARMIRTYRLEAIAARAVAAGLNPNNTSVEDLLAELPANDRARNAVERARQRSRA